MNSLMLVGVRLLSESHCACHSVIRSLFSRNEVTSFRFVDPLVLANQHDRRFCA